MLLVCELAAHELEVDFRPICGGFSDDLSNKDWHQIAVRNG